MTAQVHAGLIQARLAPGAASRCAADAAEMGTLEIPMKEHELRTLIGKVKDGKVSRRSFVRRMLMLGLTAPLANANALLLQPPHVKVRAAGTIVQYHQLL